MIIEYSKIKKALGYMAWLYASQYPQYESQELINEFYASSLIQNLEQPGRVYHACQYAFWSFHRKNRLARVDRRNRPTEYDGGQAKIEAKDWLRQATKRLSRKERQVVDGRLKEESWQEIAKRYGCSRMEVWRRWSSAKRKMRATFK
jgi:RNA polymerase sigma factor (sigma-70 family)